MIIFVLLIVLAIGFFGYLIYSYFQRNTLSTKPSPSPSISAYESAKLQSYDKYKQQIKAKLNLTDQEFENLKRFSTEE